MQTFANKSVLITGGTGSFGRALAERLLAENQVRRLIIFSRDEWKQWEMRHSDPIFDHPNVRYFLGDIRDHTRLVRAFHDVDIVIHAAALKQVPAAEYNPTEFVNTNVNGAMNIINAALDTQVEKIIALSTDKAVNPINLYGATKLCSDKLFIAGNVYRGRRNKPLFSVVRYGNVIGSRGSVVHYWKKLIEEGAKSLPITDERMTRFWLTLDQAVDFVVSSLGQMHGAEIFIPKIPSMRLTDLAKAIAPGLPHTFTGIREGEKLHEVLISAEDGRHTLEFSDHFVIIPEIYTHRPERMKEFMQGRQGTLTPSGFSFTSDNNSNWLTVNEMKHLI